MKNRFDGVTDSQIAFMTSSAIVGITVLSLPRIATQAAGTDGVVAILAAGIVSAVVLMLIVMLSSKFPQDTIIEYSSKIITPLPGKLTGIIFFIYFLFISGVVLRNFADVIKGFILRQTPLEVIMMLFMFAVLYIALKGILTLSKTCELFEPMVIAALVLLIVLSFKNFSVENLYPMFGRGIKPYLQGIPTLLPVFLGYEIFLFIFPFAKNKKSVLKFSLIGFCSPFILFFLLTIVTIGVYGADAANRSLYPTLQLAKYIIFPGAFAERFDIFFMIFWIFASFTTMALNYYLASFSITRVLGLRNYKPFAVMILPLVYMIGILPQNILQILSLTQYIGYAGLGVLALSIVMLVIASISKKGG